MPAYKAGDVVTVDEVEYTVSEPSEAYMLEDAEGNVVEMLLSQIEEGAAVEDEDMPEMSAEEMSAMDPKEFQKHKAKLAAQMGK